MRPATDILGVRVHPWTMEETLAEIVRRVDAGQFTQHVVVNVAKMVNLARDEDLQQSIASCDIVNIDGQGVVWGARMLGLDIPERVAGIDLFLRLVELAAQRREPVYLLGAREEVVHAVAEILQQRHPALQVAGAHHGYFWDDEEAVVDDIRASEATYLFVAISSPKKERFIERWADRLGVRFAMGVGGSFDVVAGRTRRAPELLQRCGLEWAFRLAQEPRRLGPRYLETNARFAWMLLRERLRPR